MSQTPSEIVENEVDLVLASEHLKEIRLSYDSTIIRSYVWARFVIIHIDILEMLDRLVPKRGRILDMGCGFGLFSLFLAMRSPERSIHGVDLSAKRIAASRGIQDLGIGQDLVAPPRAQRRLGYQINRSVEQAGKGCFDIHDLPARRVPRRKGRQQIDIAFLIEGFG